MDDTYGVFECRAVHATAIPGTPPCRRSERVRPVIHAARHAVRGAVGAPRATAALAPGRTADAERRLQRISRRQEAYHVRSDAAGLIAKKEIAM